MSTRVERLIDTALTRLHVGLGHVFVYILCIAVVLRRQLDSAMMNAKTDRQSPHTVVLLTRRQNLRKNTKNRRKFTIKAADL